MSEIKRFTPDNSGSMLAAVVWDSEGGWVRYKDHLADVERLTSKRDAAQAEVDRLKTLLTVERGEVATLRDRLWPVTHERDAARAEVERLIGERVAAQAETKRLIDRLAWAEARVDADAETGRIAAERDAALNEVERLRAEVERLQANGQAMLDTSRPTDEDIWREVFFRCVSEYITGDKRLIVADSMLAEYRKRWPR